MNINLESIDSIAFEEYTHECVDLGLSVLWASCNLGSVSPEGYGDYFAWGEVEQKETYTEDNYSLIENDSYKNLGINISSSKYDAATTIWGDGWRMPTIKDAEELTDMCEWIWTTEGRVNGYKIIGPSGKSIFLPASGQRRHEFMGIGSQGYYWTASASTEYITSAYTLNFSGYGGRWSANRSFGFTIRAVKDK